ncbi:MAG: DUF4389 domain-containing protein [Pseudomonadota bacterium]
MSDDNGFQMNAPRDGKTSEGLFMRLVYMIMIWLMLSLASTLLTAITVLQYLIMLINQGAPNERVADFGTDLGIWIAKAARYQTAASDEKPWPWSELD